MLEIIFLVWFCKKLAGMAREKNRPGGWGALGAILWISGEIGGAVLAINSNAEGGGIYGYMIMGALLGAVIAYIIVVSLKPVPREGELPVARML